MRESEGSFEILIIGAGLAGMSLALRLAESGRDVGLIAKGPLDESSSNLAQGGIAAAVGPEDSPAAHARDTISAGGGLCKPETVDYVVSRGPECIAWLTDRGVDFTRTNTDGDRPLHLTREGGHSRRRVVHSADATGRAVMSRLREQVAANPRISILTDRIVIDLITGAKLGASTRDRCLGAYALDRRTNAVCTLAARIVVLATGGASKVYMYTSNMDTATGDGIAMAWRAGCRAANLEFVQFHPTCLYHPHAKSVLISEAVRGEGGHLLLPDGTRFMPRHDERAELAPRDIVARAIDYEMKRGGLDSVFLDISHKPSAEILELFPNIARHCRAFGVDITQDPIPVVPAAHYTCGGIVTDLEARSDIPGLYAIGECAHTGLHGANRLASNSLLECAVFAAAAHDRILHELDAETADGRALPAWDESRVTDPDEQIVVAHNWHELRRFMWDYVGIVRTADRLQTARVRIDVLRDEIEGYYVAFLLDADLDRNLAEFHAFL
ncbi:MAG: L-aspartate oxidase, partial [Gammaproteobacteria bacterium]